MKLIWTLSEVILIIAQIAFENKWHFFFKLRYVGSRLGTSSRAVERETSPRGVIQNRCVDAAVLESLGVASLLRNTNLDKKSEIRREYRAGFCLHTRRCT